MTASEIEQIEARLPSSLETLPSPAQMERLIARLKHERNEQIALGFSRLVSLFGRGLVDSAWQIRRIAIACTAARLHHKVA
jgi:hypothetical protein